MFHGYTISYIFRSTLSKTCVYSPTAETHTCSAEAGLAGLEMLLFLMPYLILLVSNVSIHFVCTETLLMWQETKTLEFWNVMCFDVTHLQKPSPQVYTKSAQRQVDLKLAAWLFILLAPINSVENLQRKGRKRMGVMGGWSFRCEEDLLLLWQEAAGSKWNKNKQFWLMVNGDVKLCK